MYKVIIDNQEVFSTDDGYEYIQYCVEKHIIYELVRGILPQTHTIELATKQS